MTINVHHPHDSFAKRMLSDIKVARSLMKSHIPAHIAKRVDWDSLQLTNKSFISEELDQYYSDVIYKCTLDNNQAYIYNFVEHQSTPDEWLAFRMLRYNVQLMEQHLSEGNSKLPIIINVCIYAGQVSPYPYSTNIFDYFELPDLAKETMFNPIDLVDLTLGSQEELLKDETEDETARLVKVLLKQGIQRDYLNWIKSNKEIIVKLTSGIFGISAIIYILGTDEVNDQKTLFKAILEASPEQNEIVMTAAQRLIDEGMQQGVQQGMQQGVQQGMQQGVQQGMQQGMQNKAIEIARSMLKKGLDIKLIQEVTNLSRAKIEGLKK